MASSSSSSLLLLSIAAAAVVALAAGANTTHVHFFMHDIQSGSNPTAVKIIKGPNSTAGPAGVFGFGNVYVVDDLLTEGPSPSSAAVGRAQGFYAFASQSAAVNDTALLMTLNVVFQGGPHNGSTLTVLSRDAIFAAERELPVVGGTGDFRMARGYVLMKTSTMANGGDAVLEWDAYVTTDPADLAAAAAAAGPAEAQGLAPPGPAGNANAASGDSPAKFYVSLLSLLCIFLHLWFD